MGLLKNSYFLDLMEKEAQRDRMELARREQEFLNGRGVPVAKPTVGLSATISPKTGRIYAPIPNAKTNGRRP